VTPDHQPQAALVTLVAGLKLGAKKLFDGLGVQEIAKSRAAGGVAINLHVLRHYESRTYGTPVNPVIEGNLRTIAAGPDKDPVKQRAVMTIVKSELNLDIAEVRKLVKPDKPIWSDLDEAFKGDKSPTAAKDKEALKEEIVDRVKAGENEVAAQDLDRWSA
jgi:hypothetical protein